MKTNLFKYVRTGNGFKERLHIKSFATLNEACEFQNKRSDNEWKLAETNSEFATFKRGIYAFVGGKWHNVKDLDPSILNHI